VIDRSRQDQAQLKVDTALAALLRVGIAIPAPWNARGLCDDLAALRRRPIHLVPGSRFGWWHDHLWIAGEHADHIVWADRSSDVHQRHGVLHEIGHLVLGHAGIDIEPGADLRALRPHLGYEDPEEIEAECFATTAGLLAEVRPGPDTGTLSTADLAAADRLAAMMGAGSASWT
jgi:hypothetical protein